MKVNDFVYVDDEFKLRWKSRGVEFFKTEKSAKIWNSRFAGKECGYIRSDGYLSFEFNGRAYRNHRVIWEIVTGNETDDNMEIDHIDHNATNNNIENLRVVDRKENCKNQSMMPHNSSGFTGVHWWSARNKWRASIECDGKVRTKTFEYFNDAVEWRKEMNINPGFHKNHGDKKK